MTAMTCKTCKHWTRFINEKEFIRLKRGSCSSDRFIYDEEDNGDTNTLNYWDCEGYHASFDTGEDFGCIHWVKKPSSTNETTL